VIDMAVGDENRIKARDLCPKGLLTEIDGSIDEDLCFVMFDQDRDSKAFVARI
jgi:hypothetical protein